MRVQQHSVQYPTMAKIAKDYLAIQGSAVASERSFSRGGITGTARRNCLLPETFEALQLLKSAYCQGHISATTQAELAVPHSRHAVDTDQ
jgi:hAT family C-terminal dimerisation region